MKIIAGGQDITQLSEKLAWAGDDKEIARTLSVSYVRKYSDPLIPRIRLQLGDAVSLYTDGGELLFFGIIFDLDRTAAGSTASFFAYDLAVYIKSEISRVFDTTPEMVAQMVCGDLGIPFGGAVQTGVHVYFPHLGKSAYDAIMAAYTQASRVTGKKYIPLMQGDALYVLEKGQPSGAVLDGWRNHIDSSYKESIRDAVDKVVITDKSGGVIDEVKNGEWLSRYGTLQKVYKQEDGKDAVTAAKAMLQGPEETAACEGLSDYRCRAGTSVILHDNATGLWGDYFITADSHSFENGVIRMSLTLSFKNKMDEKEIEKTESKDGAW